MNLGKLEIALFVFIIAIIALSVVNFSIIYSRGQAITAAATAAEKEKIPAKLELTKISDSLCKECFDIDSVISSLKNGNVNITSERSLDITSEEAQSLISRYGIEKIPTVIATGEINRSNAFNSNWKTADDKAWSYYISLSPPYTDALTNEIKGLVSLSYIIDESCPKCADLTQFIDFLKESGAKFSLEEIIDYNSTIAQEMIKQYGVEKLPAIIISRDVLEYKAIAEIWDQLNATEKEGYYVLHTLMPPYRDLKTNKTEGFVTAIYLRDPLCSQCYDVMLNKEILESNIGIVIGNETFIDTNSTPGASLINKYNITKVPIVILSPEAGFYLSFAGIWPQVGDVANDSWYIMREPGLVGTYKDLEKNQTVQQVALYAGEYQYQPKSLEVKAGTLVKLTFLNTGQAPHSFAIDELGIRSKVLSPRESQQLEFVVNKTGTFKYYSYYQDDRQKGVEGTLTVE